MSRFVLSYRNFRWLWTGSLFAYASYWIQQASMGWVVYEITGSGALLGAVMGVRAIPMLALAPLAGVAADRYNRRRLLQGSQVLAAITAFAFGVGLALHWVGTWWLFVFSLLMGATGVLDRPARMSMAFELVPRDIAVKAVALNIIGNNLSRVFAPALAGYLIVWVGVAGNFVIQAVLYLIAASVVFLVVIPPHRAPAGQITATADLLEGLSYAANDPSTRLLVLLGAIQFFILVPTLGTLFPIYAKDVFDAGPQGLGLLYTAIGIGGMCGGYLAGVLSRYDRMGLIQVAAILFFCVSVVGIAMSPTFPVAFVCAVFAGTAEMVQSTTNMATLQMSAPEAMRGRITSLIQLYPALISLGAFLIGPLADLAGARGASFIAAGVCTVVITALWVFSPRLRALRLSQFH
jgi:MFS family permease